MARYMHLFENQTDYNNARSNDYKEPWVSATNIGEVANPSYRVNYNKSEKEKLLGTPLTFEITSSGEIYWKSTDTAYTVTLEYSKNEGKNWTQITSTTDGKFVPVYSGEIVQFRCGTDDGYATMSSGYSRYNTFSGTTCGFKVKGNVMSLLNKNFASLDTLQSAYTFQNLFKFCAGLTDVNQLVLPATTLVQDCYDNMFNYCTGLTAASQLVLPATTLANYCYEGMFSTCRSLTTAPELPATTLANGCYRFMFNGCSALTTAPALPITTLTQQCYYGMFNYCTGLITAPELPATILANECYKEMFYNCFKLTYIKCLATDISASQCTNEWLRYGASTGTFVKNPSMSSWPTGYNGIPNGWTVQDATS